MNNSKMKILKSEMEKTLKERNLTFFVGAGISKISKLPTWNELINEMSKEINLRPKKKYDTNELLSIPQKFYCVTGNNNDIYYNFLNKKLNSDNYNTNEIHDLIMLFKPKKIITTNFDNLIERTAIKLLLPYTVVSADSDVSKIDVNPFILKVHGDLKNRNVVLKEDDYLNYDKKFNLINTLLKTIFATDAVVFIGYNVDDYNIKLILNWARNALGDKFIPPYFIYSGNNKLSKIDIKYYESRSLKLIDSHIFVKQKSNYIDRYRETLKFLLNIKENKSDLISEKNSFNFLYNKFLILNQLNSIRMVDIVSYLNPYIDGDQPYVLKCKNDYDLFNMYFKLKEKKLTSKLTKLENYKINVIDSVLSKANIQYYYNNNEYIPFNIEGKNIGEELVIFCDYYQMNDFVKKEYKDIKNNFKKAYYLSKLNDYENALELYEKISDESFTNDDFLTLFLSQINRSNIYSIGSYHIDHKNYKTKFLYEFYKKYSDNLFENLPIHAQVKYSFLSDFGKLKSIYKNVYKALSHSTKYIENLNVGTIYFGGSGIDKQLRLYNESIDFSQSNYIVDDEFAEYGDLIRASILTFLTKISHQDRNHMLSDNRFEMFGNTEENIILNEVDLYCLVNYVPEKELKKILRDLELDTLNFNILSLKKFTLNFLRPFNDQMFLKTYANWHSSHRNKLLTFLTLLEYTALDIDTLNEILELIFSQKLDFVDIHYKYDILSNQKRQGLEFDHKTFSIIFSKIKEYLLLELSFLEDKKVLELHSISNTYYYDLIDFIQVDGSVHNLDEINLIISDLIKYNNYDVNRRLLYLMSILNNENKQMINAYINNSLIAKFDENLIIDYLIYKKDISLELGSKLFEYINDYMKKEANRKLKENVLPKDLRFSWIIKIAKLFFFNDIKIFKLDFLIGFNDELDFFINPVDFDYSKFNLFWITSNGHSSLIKLLKNMKIKDSIKPKLKEYLDIKVLPTSDRVFITKIYLKYFN